MDQVVNFEEIIELSKDLKILYVEDDIQLLEKTAYLLSNIFLEVDTATNGEEAIFAYENKKYDLVITDIKMPKKDGRDFIHAIKMIDEEQPIIVTSAYNDSNRLMELIELGIDSFLHKPISTKNLFKTLHLQVKKIKHKKVNSSKIGLKI